MPKIGEMFRVFKREKKSQRGLDKNHSRPKTSKRDNRSVLDADSFIFMPGGAETHGQFCWESFPFSQLQEVESRRKTHIGLVQSQETNGLQEVNLFLSPELQEKDGNLVKVFNRRLSGTLVKARKSVDDLVEDEPVIRDYAFLLSTRERLSQELSGRYVYDRLVRPPLQPRNTPQQQKPSQQSWKYPAGTDGKKSPLLTDHRKRGDKDEVVLRRTAPRSSTPVKDNSLLKVNRGQLTCNVRDTHDRRDHRSLKRPLSGLTVDSGYSNLEFSQSVLGSEYAMPFDAINWDGE